MSPNEKNNWKPSPTMLAAYADGEFEGRDDLAALKAGIEAYLADHPDAIDELTGYRRLRKVWHETTPAKPDAAQWDTVAQNIRRETESGFARHPRTNRRTWTGLFAAAGFLIAVAAVWFAYQDRSNPQSNEPVVQRNNPTETGSASDEFQPLPVATMEEVEILSVDGDDIPTLIVGTLPVEGTIEPADAGDVSDFLIPDGDNSILVVNSPDGTPMIIAQVD